MAKTMIKIHNVETGEVIEREMTADELAQLEAENAATQLQAEAKAAKASEKAALLEKLGITEAEAKLLLS